MLVIYNFHAVHQSSDLNFDAKAITVENELNIWIHCTQLKRVHDGGCSSVVRASAFTSEDPGFDPLVGQGEEQFFCPSESLTFVAVQTCL